MKSISIESIKEENKLGISFENGLDFISLQGDIIKSNVSCQRVGKKYTVLINKNLFSKNSFNFKLIERHDFNLMFEYALATNEFSLRFENSRDYPRYKLEIGNVIYKIGESTITGLILKNLVESIDEKSKSVNCVLYVLEEDEKQTLEFYFSALEKFEKLGDGIKDDVGKSRRCIKWMIDNFPITLKGIIERAIEPLKNHKFLEVEQCIVNIEELNKRPIFFSPSIGETEMESPQSYIQRFDSHRENLTRAFAEEDISAIGRLSDDETQKIPARIRRVKRLLIIQEKYSPRMQKIEIQNKIDQINQFETYIVQSSFMNRPDLLGKILNLLRSLTSLLTGVPTNIVGRALDFITTVKTLWEIPQEFKKEKEQREITFIQRRETIISSKAHDIKHIKREALRAAERRIHGRKKLWIIEFIATLRGYEGVTYRWVADRIRGVSEGWVREVMQMLDRVVLSINYNPTPHRVYIYRIDERDFWNRIYQKFA